MTDTSYFVCNKKVLVDSNEQPILLMWNEGKTSAVLMTQEQYNNNDKIIDELKIGVSIAWNIMRTPCNPYLPQEGEGEIIDITDNYVIFMSIISFISRNGCP
jgi:hypothetical protein